jgi:hypothetical protein
VRGQQLPILVTVAASDPILLAVAHGAPRVDVSRTPCNHASRSRLALMSRAFAAYHLARLAQSFGAPAEWICA